MDWMNLLSAALTLVVSFLLRWFFAYINVQIDEQLFNTIVAGIVLWFMTLFGANTTRTGFMYARARLMAK